MVLLNRFDAIYPFRVPSKLHVHVSMIFFNFWVVFFFQYLMQKITELFFRALFFIFLMKRVCLMNVPIGSDPLWLYSPVQSENHMSPQLSGPVEEGKQTEWRQSIDPGYLIVQPSTASSQVLASILGNT